MKNHFNAYVVRKEEQGGVKAAIEQLKKEDLPNGDVTVQVQYSSVNYKDGLATLDKGGVVREYPMVPGIDLAGTVEESVSGRFAPGDRVISTGFEPGVSHYGGYSEYARLRSEWLVPLPPGLSEKEAMAIGTARIYGCTFGRCAVTGWSDTGDGQGSGYGCNGWCWQYGSSDSGEAWL